MPKKTMSMTDVRKKYEPKILVLFDKIRTALDEAGFSVEDPFDTDYEECNWSICGKNHRREGFSIDITIAESQKTDGEDKFGIGFRIEAVGNGGVVIGGFMPGNYSSDVWVSRKNPQAVEERWKVFEDGIDPDQIVEAIQEHYL